jgi:hypothetical protein
VNITAVAAHNSSFPRVRSKSQQVSASTILQIKVSPLADVIESYVPLRRAGRRFVARCPFHEERHASFSVDPAKQLFYCFGCNFGGDAIAFVQRIEACDFRQAVGILATRFGIDTADSSVDHGQLTTRRAELRVIDERIKEILRCEQIRCANELEQLRQVCRKSDLNSLPAEVYVELRRVDVRYVLAVLQQQEDAEKFLSASPTEQEKRIDEALNDGYVHSGKNQWEVPQQW